MEIIAEIGQWGTWVSIILLTMRPIWQVTYITKRIFSHFIDLLLADSLFILFLGPVRTHSLKVGGQADT